jgi:hypothetical protein
MRGSGAWKATACVGTAAAVPVGCGSSSTSSSVPTVATVSRTDTFGHLIPLPAVPARNDVPTSVVPSLDRLDG